MFNAIAKLSQLEQDEFAVIIWNKSESNWGKNNVHCKMSE